MDVRILSGVVRHMTGEEFNIKYSGEMFCTVSVLDDNIHEIFAKLRDDKTKGSQIHLIVNTKKLYMIAGNNDYANIITISNDSRVTYIEREDCTFFAVTKIAIKKIILVEDNAIWENQHDCNVVVKYNPMLLKYVKKWQTHQMCLEAVRKDGIILQYVLEKTEDICVAAVTQNVKSFRFVSNKSLLLCKLVCSIDANTIRIIPHDMQDDCFDIIMKNDPNIINSLGGYKYRLYGIYYRWFPISDTWSQVVSKEISGKELNAIFGSVGFCKITRDDENHYGFQYVDGENRENVPFYPTGESGLHFTTSDHIQQCYNWGTYIREVKIPDDARVYVKKGHMIKADVIFLGKKKKLSEMTLSQLINVAHYFG